MALVDPAGHMYPAAQLPSHALVFWPGLDPYRPGAQSPVQLLLVLPAALPNTPSGHGVQEEFVAPPLLYVPARQLWGHATALPASQ